MIMLFPQRLYRVEWSRLESIKPQADGYVDKIHVQELVTMSLKSLLEKNYLALITEDSQFDELMKLLKSVRYNYITHLIFTMADDV